MNRLGHFLRHSPRAVACLVSVAAAVIVGCSDSTTEPQSASLAIMANATSPSVLNGPGGVRLDVPAGASSTDITIVVTSAPGSRRAASAGAIVSTPLTLTPEGAMFGKVIEVTIPISPSSLPAGKTLDDVVVMSAPAGSTVYVPMPTRRAGNAVIATTPHFSDFVAVVPPTPVDPPDEACGIPTTTWSFAASTTTIRSILVQAPSVYAIADSVNSTLPIYALSIDAGSVSGSPVSVERPTSPVSTHLPRLSMADVNGSAQLFVSYLRVLYDPGTAPMEYQGGLVRVGPLSALPAAASLLVGLQGSVDGVFHDVREPRVLHWPLLSAPVATLARFSLVATAESLDTGFTLTAPTTPFERAVALYAGERLVGFVRANDDDPMGMTQTWTAWSVLADRALAPITLPSTITTFAAHDTQPTIYAVDAFGKVSAYSFDDAFGFVVRDVAQLPATYTVAPSSAKMAYTNGSIVFPAWKNGTAPVILRVHVASGAVEEWPESDGTVVGWSTLTANDGIVCYAGSSNAVRCGCLDGAFIPVP